MPMSPNATESTAVELGRSCVDSPKTSAPAQKARHDTAETRRGPYRSTQMPTKRRPPWLAQGDGVHETERQQLGSPAITSSQPSAVASWPATRRLGP